MGYKFVWNPFTNNLDAVDSLDSLSNLALSDLTDCDTTDATQDQVLAYNVSSGEWTPAFLHFDDPLTTRGDLMYRDDTNTTVRLPIGTVNQVLTSDGADVAWASITDIGFADPMTTRGDLIFKNASNVTIRLSTGTVDQVLQSDGTDTSWQTLVAADISDFDTEVANNTSVALNTAKETNATHTGEVTGSGALTITNDAVTYAKIQNVVADDVILGNISGAGSIAAELTAAQVRSLVNVTDISISGSIYDGSGTGTTTLVPDNPLASYITLTTEGAYYGQLYLVAARKDPTAGEPQIKTWKIQFTVYNDSSTLYFVGVDIDIIHSTNNDSEENWDVWLTLDQVNDAVIVNCSASGLGANRLGFQGNLKLQELITSDLA
jgi:hypothetical protein